MFKIIRAEREHLEDVAPLFDAYRVFYKQESDQDKALEFLTERFLNDESVIYMAYENEKAIGFTQLYTTFSSVSLKTAYILNDIFVDPEHRKNGVGEALLLQAQKLCTEKNFKGISLETAHDNPAQSLYEKLGWEKDAGYFHYFWTSKQVTN
ncbi:GNAT family N-acetyltransferase [Cytophaga sp. FL35]|uniref:GNAT family N-acetyltransferase n=1 Tax=Cytophaga sp. FL35 TaxID=1904456 RepID=UPI001653B160|nr:GNAT family N-acetyltransferase [Cytophaga sp. FL35]MBC6998688.1 GNAT family N-acetyltransferase [Cytophaga sp. FL35]